MKLIQLLKNKKYILALITSLIVGAISLILWFYFVSKIEALPAQPSPDLNLNLLPKVEHTAVGWFYIIGFVFIIALIVFATLFKEPARFPYVILVLGLATLIRDILFSITVLDAPSGRPDKLIPFVEFDRDLFPSGHVGIPFLGALLTNVKWLRYTSFAMSAIMAAIVMLTRIHYSLDVFGGYIIFYGIHKFCQKYVNKYFDFS